LTINDEIDERLDVVKSTKAAAAYLKNANDTLKDWLLAAASYNRGIGGVLRDMKWQKAKSYFDMEQNHETGRYVYRILAMKIIMENPTAYGFNIPKEQCYPSIKTRKYIINKTIENLSDWAITKGSNFKILRKLNPWLRTTKLTIKNKSYTLLLPLNTENIRPYSSYN
jgi:membrane-bound lytic murein transglycosylase D